MRGNKEDGEPTLMSLFKSSNLQNTELNRFFRYVNQEVFSPERDHDSLAWENISMGLKSPQNTKFMASNSPTFQSPIGSPMRFISILEKERENRQLITLLPVQPGKSMSVFSNQPLFFDPADLNQPKVNGFSTVAASNPKSLFDFIEIPFDALSESVIQPCEAKEPEYLRDCTRSSLRNSAEPRNNRSSSPFALSLIEFPTLKNRPVEFKMLFAILLNVFSHQPIAVADYCQLSPLEKDILNAILHRKFMRKLTVCDLQLPVEHQVATLNQIIQITLSKRPDECYKLTLTRGIKHLKKNLNVEGATFPVIDTLFYERYFGSTAQQLGLPLSAFHYPLTGRQKVPRLNSNYFDLIFKSNDFLESLLSYLESQLVADYSKVIGKKLATLLVRWEKLILSSVSPIASSENAIKDYIAKNKRCKLPWTIFEVKESIERFQALVKTLRNMKLAKSKTDLDAQLSL